MTDQMLIGMTGVSSRRPILLLHSTKGKIFLKEQTPKQEQMSTIVAAGAGEGLQFRRLLHKQHEPRVRNRFVGIFVKMPGARFTTDMFRVV
eukprot:409666-Amphidinium_carterae.3